VLEKHNILQFSLAAKYNWSLYVLSDMICMNITPVITPLLFQQWKISGECISLYNFFHKLNNFKSLRQIGSLRAQTQPLFFVDQLLISQSQFLSWAAFKFIFC
jgi:hypothetical protein